MTENSSEMLPSVLQIIILLIQNNVNDHEILKDQYNKSSSKFLL